MAQLSGVYTGYKYHVPVYNESFVDGWSRELAYFVGLILSDGHVSNSNLRHLVCLKMCDKDVIEKVKNITEHKGNVVEYHTTNGYKPSYTINFHGKKFWDFFTNLGFDNNKSHSARFPKDVPIESVSHLIRGVFDGDGSLSLGRNKYPFARICGTRSLLESIINLIGFHYTIHKHFNIYIIQYTGERAVKFLDYLYNDSTNDTRMDRKYNKYLELISNWR
jgi:hypothetical protein